MPSASLFTKRKAKLRFQHDWQQGLPFEADINVRPLEHTLIFMGMGGPGDHPIGDLIHWGRNPFPPDIADMLRQLYSYDPKIRDTFALDAFDWEEGRALDEGRAKLRAELQKHQSKKI